MACRRAGHPPVRQRVRDHRRRSRRADVPGRRHREHRAGEVGRADALGLGALRRSFPRFGRRLLRQPHRHLRRPGRHARLSFPDRRRVVDGSRVPRACDQPALVDGAHLRDPDDGACLLDLGPVLHPQGVRAPGLRRDLGADAGHHEYRARTSRSARCTRSSKRPDARIRGGRQCVRRRPGVRRKLVEDTS